MSVLVQGHQHDSPVVFTGAGTFAQQLVMQTGTIIFDFLGSADKWLRDRLTLPVLKLPLASLLLHPEIRAIAWAAPASLGYGPPYFVRTLIWGHEVVGGRVRAVPDWAEAFGKFGETPKLAAGWAVDRTQATHVSNQIELAVDLAVLGQSRLMRLAYSVFVTIKPRATAAVVSP
jgi:hypothetical protein